jgi:hypothetical protein
VRKLEDVAISLSNSNLSSGKPISGKYAEFFYPFIWNTTGLLAKKTTDLHKKLKFKIKLTSIDSLN